MQTADTATQARANFLSAAPPRHGRRAQRHAFRNGFRSFIENTFTDPSVVAEFGLPPRKAATKTVETKVAAAAKTPRDPQGATHHGSEQKKAIHGTVPATAPAEVGAPATTTAPPVATPTVTAAKPAS